MEELFNKVVDLFKTYTAALPTSVVAVIMIVVGLKVGKAILKLIGLVLVVLAVIFYVNKV